MRILAFNYEYPPLGGGGGVVFQQIVEVLATRHQVAVVTSGFKDLPSHERSDGLEIFRVPVWMRTQLSTATLPSLLSYVPSSWRWAKRILKNQSFDLINSHFVVPSSPSAHWAARRFSIPHVLSIHGGDLYDPSKTLSPHRVPVLRRVVRSLLCSADRVVAQSTNTADNARDLYAIDRSIDIIPLGIAPPSFQAATRAQMNIEEDRFVIVTVGRLISRKGLDDLLHVLAALNDPRDLLLVIGEGPKRAELEALAVRLGLAGRVQFTGRIAEDDKWRYLGISDLYASTSLHEGFGLVFLEAMHTGLPIVAYDCGGQTDFLDDRNTGSLVPAGRRGEFVNAVRRLKVSPEMRSSCAAHNIQHVREFYIDRCAERYESLFEETIRAGADPATAIGNHTDRRRRARTSVTDRPAD